jgi:hypothetical protein
MLAMLTDAHEAGELKFFNAQVHSTRQDICDD